ncbi:MAG: ABC transporter ATP-binding protein [bacterium]|nr:ABC transporter ATP-binding protein [bacterium]
MIKAKQIVKKFESGTNVLFAVNHVDLIVPKGQFITITGRSGSGKSTLLYQLGLLDKPTSGDIELAGRDVINMSEDERTFYRLSKLGYVFQDYAILPSLTALENVLLPLLMLGLPDADARRMATDAMVRVGLEDKLINYPSQLSGGQQQRVAIARAIAHDPEILFADEPTANLDTETSDMILELFLKLHKEGQTIVMVTHEKDYAEKADRIIELADGKIVRDETLRRN